MTGIAETLGGVIIEEENEESNERKRKEPFV